MLCSFGESRILTGHPGMSGLPYGARRGAHFDPDPLKPDYYWVLDPDLSNEEAEDCLLDEFGFSAHDRHYHRRCGEWPPMLFFLVCCVAYLSDFVTHLSVSTRGYDGIFSIIDRFSRLGRLIPCCSSMVSQLNYGSCSGY